MRISGKRFGVVIGLVLAAMVAAVILLPIGSAAFGVLPERGDWKYEDLPGGCVVYRNNSRDIHLSRGKTEILVGKYLSYVAYDERSMFAQQVTLPETWDSALDGVDGLTPSYYIVPAEGEVRGPFENETEFERACAELGLSPPKHWIRTTDLPKQAEQEQ